MKYLSSTIVALAVCHSAVLALPQKGDSTAGTYTIPVFHRSETEGNNADKLVDFEAVSEHLDWLAAKYAASKSPDVRKPANNIAPNQKRATESKKLSLTEKGSAWAVQAGFGGGLTFPLILDTASSDCLVSDAVYSPAHSKTAKNTGTPFGFPYSNGRQAGGTIWRDNFHIGGLTVPDVAVGVSTTKFLSKAGGVCGLAPDGSSAFNNKFHPFFYQMQSLLSEPVFSFALSKKGGSQVTFGGTDASKFSGPIQTVPTVDPKNGFWKLSGIFHDGGLQGDFILDSASDLMVIPPNTVDAFFNGLGAVPFVKNGVTYGSYRCYIPPTIKFDFGTATVTAIDSVKSIGKTSEGRCVLPIVAKDLGFGIPLVGGPLFESSYVVFNTSSLTVGFAERK
ncbi:unnamed protein product [Tilletia laevis]|uniref:Peptidase A1 domain-containing protein n=2 Tax=Tilletia TaxID=13289 RepID=A0A177V527_9BASI|nr:hypothetical protein CF336_g975 [Tilletia laevis]KAE8264329.1 hypothetical protein A4X03_0g1027 [Tilletia caries]KAE8208349.1 hypothetical protein CF335_g483 [Tilletia laevis]CAD6892025.1 unnamed protein product [Tilletia caries]CAD6931482.1 unnamed protein product [Tilletia caries]